MRGDFALRRVPSARHVSKPQERRATPFSTFAIAALAVRLLITPIRVCLGVPRRAPAWSGPAMTTEDPHRLRVQSNRSPSRRIGLGRRRFLRQPAQVDEVLPATYRSFNPEARRLDELVRGHSRVLHGLERSTGRPALSLNSGISKRQFFITFPPVGRDASPHA